MRYRVVLLDEENKICKEIENDLGLLDDIGILIWKYRTEPVQDGPDSFTQEYRFRTFVYDHSEAGDLVYVEMKHGWVET